MFSFVSDGWFNVFFFERKSKFSIDCKASKKHAINNTSTQYSYRTWHPWCEVSMTLGRGVVVDTYGTSCVVGSHQIACLSAVRLFFGWLSTCVKLVFLFSFCITCGD
jgi:hypothetical protein